MNVLILAKTRIIGEIRNIGLHSACDVYIYDAGDHPDASETWTRHNAISINGAEQIDKEFDLAKTTNYKFTFNDTNQTCMNRNSIMMFRQKASILWSLSS